jgi:energy-coupling factor transporter ATP-binding protein EcfA2
MAELGLSPFANKIATSLSGGNKRKLCVAIALIGRPPILVLDEPTTGVDAVSKRFMWTVLTRIAAKERQCSIILVTHSMEEAEALCTRIGIMVGGRLRCIGSSTHLKARFGEGYQLDLRLHGPSEGEVASVLARFPPELRQSVGWETLPGLCATLGQAHRHQGVTENGKGWALYAAYQRAGESKAVPATTVAGWWAEGDRVDACTDFVTRDAFHGAALGEQQGLWLRYAVPAKDEAGQPCKLSAMFAALESNKERIGIATFALGQSSLEQVFVHFAGQQEEEGAPAPGVSAPAGAVQAIPAPQANGGAAGTLITALTVRQVAMDYT